MSSIFRRFVSGSNQTVSDNRGRITKKFIIELPFHCSSKERTCNCLIAFFCRLFTTELRSRRITKLSNLKLFLILRGLIWMGSSKSKLEIANSEVLKQARQLQGVSSQRFCQVNNYSIVITGLSLFYLIISFKN